MFKLMDKKINTLFFFCLTGPMPDDIAFTSGLFADQFTELQLTIYLLVSSADNFANSLDPDQAKD